MTSQEGNATQ